MTTFLPYLTQVKMNVNKHCFGGEKKKIKLVLSLQSFITASFMSNLEKG